MLSLLHGWAETDGSWIRFDSMAEAAVDAIAPMAPKMARTNAQLNLNTQFN